MNLVELLSAAWQTVVQTAGYLLAYLYVLVLAPLAHLALLAVAPARPGWLRTRLNVRRAAMVALTSPLDRRTLEASLRAMAGPTAAMTYLAVSHALTAPYWILLGPLLGKDFLLSHGLGVALFLLFAAVLARGLRVGTAAAPSDPTPEPRPIPGLLGREAVRLCLLVAAGLALGGLVAAWGFSPWSWAPAEVGGGGFWTQLAGGAIGLALALLGIPPIANLFVGTYLWKVGLAHAGIVTFFCAATAAPTRWRVYARAFGPSGGVQLVVALCIAALLAGLGTAWLFGAAGVEIHYKLIPEQLWEVR